MAEIDSPIPSVDRLRRKKTNILLSDEFADRVNAVAGLLDDSVQLKDLRVKSPGSYSNVFPRERQAELLSRVNPPAGWKAFLDTLTPQEKGPLISAITRIQMYGTLELFRKIPGNDFYQNSITFTFMKRALRKSLS